MSSEPASTTTTAAAAAAAAAVRAAEQAKFKEKCDAHVASALYRNPTVKFLLEKLVTLGCNPPPNLIRCMDCGTKQAGGGFGMVQETVITKDKAVLNGDEAQRRVSLPQCQRSVQDLKHQLQDERDGKVELKLLPEIFLCQQHIRNESHAHQSIAHELIHAIDMCRTKMDPLHNCVHMACTEIRAENLSGECSAYQEAMAGRIEQFANHGQVCVKRRAVLSVKANPNCRDRAHEFVDAAFDRCYQDTYPFDRHPNLR